MKIRRGGGCPASTLIKNVCPGEVVEFPQVFHQDNLSDDLFIRVRINYAFKYHDTTGQIPLVNLRTGKFSLVSPQRYCVPIPKAEVCIP